MTLSRAVFLDRDGIINALCPDPLTGQQESPLDLKDVKLINGISREIYRLGEAGYLLVGVTNQPSAAKGRITLELQDAIHTRVLALLAADGVVLDTWKICPHHPDGTVKDLTIICTCRKPKPGMLVEAAKELGIDLASSWMIGDSDSDAEAGRAAGTRTVRIGAHGTHKRSHTVPATFSCASLEEAVETILGDSSS